MGATNTGALIQFQARVNDLRVATSGSIRTELRGGIVSYKEPSKEVGGHRDQGQSERTQGSTKVNSRSVDQEASQLAECSSHILGAEASVAKEIYWSDDESGADEVDLEKDSWSVQDLIRILLQVQQQFKQERQDWLGQKGDIEAGQLRLEEDNRAKFLELEEKITAQLMRQEKENQAGLGDIAKEFRDSENKAWFENMEAKNVLRFQRHEEKNKARFEKMEAEYAARLQRLEEENQALSNWRRMEEGRRQKTDAEVAEQLRFVFRKLVREEEKNKGQFEKIEEKNTARHLRLFEKIEAENWRLDAENKDLKEELRVMKRVLVVINSRVGELEDTLELEEEWKDVDSESETEILVPEESEEAAEQTEKVLPIKTIVVRPRSLLFILDASQT